MTKKVLLAPYVAGVLNNRIDMAKPFPYIQQNTIVRKNMNAHLIEYFNKQPRLATLSTADKSGKADVAVLGSPRMVDEKTVVLTLRKNRTFANLLQDPYAVLAIMEPGKTHQFGDGFAHSR